MFDKNDTGRLIREWQNLPSPLREFCYLWLSLEEIVPRWGAVFKTGEGR